MEKSIKGNFSQAMDEDIWMVVVEDGTDSVHTPWQEGGGGCWYIISKTESAAHRLLTEERGPRAREKEGRMAGIPASHVGSGVGPWMDEYGERSWR